jgi:hypothetical protein
MTDATKPSGSRPLAWILIGFVAGIALGFFIGVSTTEFGKGVLTDMLATEKAADLEHQETVRRKGF